MRFLFVSRRGASLSLATRVVSEGHKVNFFVNNLNYKLLGKKEEFTGGVKLLK